MGDPDWGRLAEVGISVIVGSATTLGIAWWRRGEHRAKAELLRLQLIDHMQEIINELDSKVTSMRNILEGEINRRHALESRFADAERRLQDCEQMRLRIPRGEN